MRKQTALTSRWRCFRIERFVGAALAVALSLAFCLAGGGRPVLAFPIDFEQANVTGSLDTEVMLGFSLRTQDRDPRLIGLPNGGKAFSVNVDNGNLNYDQWDPTSAIAKVTHELQLKWKDYGLFGRFFYFYDAAVQSIDTDRTPLTEEAKWFAGLHVELLDAYLTGNFDVLDRRLSVRVGNMVLNWGESTFIPNGINVINPVDVAQLRVAGAEIREALKPIPAIDVSLNLTDNLSIEGFYQFLWSKTQIEPEGTFFSSNDFISPGAKRVFLGFGSNPDNPRLPPGGKPPVGSSIPRGSDNEPTNVGQAGAAIRLFAPSLAETELGAYYVHYHSRAPLVSGRTGTFEGLQSFDYAESGRYYADYPEDIDMIGGSFNTQEKTTGIAIQGELSYKFNQPLQVDDVELLYASLSPLDPFLAARFGIPGPIFGASQLGSYAFDQEVRGYRRKGVLQPQVTLTKQFGPTLGTDQLVLLGEAGATWVPNLEKQSELRYDGPGTFTSANPFFTNLKIQPATQHGGFATDVSWGYRLLARLVFNNAIGPVGLIPQVAFAHDVQGTTPSPLGNFVKGRIAVTPTLGLAYLESLQAKLSYTAYLGGEQFNLTNDRDFVSMSVSYSF